MLLDCPSMSTIPHRVTGGACVFLAEFRGELQLVLLIGEGLVSSVEADISRQKRGMQQTESQRGSPRAELLVVPAV